MMTQCLVNGHGRIIDIKTGIPGHNNDTSMWWKSRVYKWHGNINGIVDVKEIEAAKKKGQAAKYFILGDNGYGDQYGLYTQFI